jgi:leucyl aminopeptidase
MQLTLSSEAPTHVVADVLVLGVSAKQLGRDPLLQKLDRAAGGAIGQAIKDEDWKAKLGSTLRVTVRGRLKAKRVMLVGLGDEPAAHKALRLFAVKAAREGNARGGTTAVVAGSLEPAVIATLADGLVTGAYRYTRYLTGERAPKKTLKRASLLVGKKPDDALKVALAQGQAVGDAINLCRDLVNCPANDLTATKLAQVAADESKKLGMACKVLDKKAIEKAGMPLLLAVNRGSDEEPRFFHMTYKPRVPSAKKVVFVGKGLTFDSGGLCLKPADGMMDMKMDMAGAATTIAIVLSAARLKLPVEVHGIVASTDNMTGGSAYRPGDVFPSRDGKTVEIINTDAEGRLVLADALAYARERSPDYVVDHATLTGACMVALGAYRAGFFSNDEGLRTAYLDAAKGAGESYWSMPLDDDLRDQLKSSIADLKHTGTRHGGAITAALFLREFVGKTKWAHVDLAGPAYLSDTHGIYPKGGSGFGVLTALEFLRNLSAT